MEPASTARWHVASPSAERITYRRAVERVGLALFDGASGRLRDDLRDAVGALARERVPSPFARRES